MEHGSGSGDRHDASHRRKTFSGPLRYDGQKSNDTATPGEAMRLPWSPPSAPSSPTTIAPPGTAPAAPTSASPRAHKRTIAGSILQRLNFLRPTSDSSRPPSRDKEPTSPKSAKSTKSRKSIDNDPPAISPTSPKSESAMAFALRPAKTRKRKGSLRKTALLGGKRIMSESRERKNSTAGESPLSKLPLQPQTWHQQDLSVVSSVPVFEGGFNAPLLPANLAGDTAAPSVKRQFSYEGSVAPTSSSDGSWVEPPAVFAARLSLVTEHKARQPSDISTNSSTNELGSPLEVRSPTSQTSYASTTDDDDVLTFDRPANAFPAQSTISLPKTMSSAATSYFPPSTPSETSLPLPSATTKPPRSPLSHTISSSSLYATHPSAPQPHDYTETEYWGWIILLLTWLTFTVGMGSCLEIWSWAWDVGETPQAPPEFHDDETLPIVGYYPAAIVLGGVVAWVWITVAWVGMKYFRHAGIEV